jgi:hypothetical protein
MSGGASPDDLIRRVATFGLDHVPDRPEVEWRGVDTDTLWDRVVGQRLTGLLVAEVGDRRDIGLVPDAVVAELESRAMARMLTLTTLEWQLVDLVGRLKAGGVLAGAVKGPALARSLYPEHWWRDFGDLDLLVPAADFERAIGVMEAAGARLILTPPSRRATALLGKGVTMRHPLGNEIDLHHTLISGSLGFGLRWDWWMGRARQVDVGGYPIATTGVVETALHLLAHLCIGGPVASLHVARDVAQSLNAVDPSSSDGQRLIAAVAKAGFDGLIQTGVSRSGLALGWHNQDWSQWVSLHPAPTSWSAVERQFETEQRSFGSVVTASWRSHPRLADRLAIIGAVAWPDADHLADRQVSRRVHLAKLGRLISPPEGIPQPDVGSRPQRPDRPAW